MRLHRFYVTEPIGNKKEITINNAELVNQIQRVFRLKKGDSIIIFDGSGSDYTCLIEEFGKATIDLIIEEANKSRYVPEREIILCAAIVKKDTFEWIVEKATELGVAKIVPIVSERSEKKSLNEERLKKIAIEASEQCGRGDVPIIESIKTLEDEVGLRPNLGDVGLRPDKVTKIAFHTEGESVSRSHLAGVGPITIFIGPEGGWSPAEIESFHKNNIPIYCLGHQILRAETAVVATLSQVVFQ